MIRGHENHEVTNLRDFRDLRGQIVFVIEEMFARNQIVFEPREITQGKKLTVQYHTWLDARTLIEDVSAQLRDIPGITEVGWEQPKRV